jgi:DNA-binding transcriptional MerR regulator
VGDDERLRISELARRTGVPVATIKFYLREGLLPRGDTTSATQALYGELHERRLRLIRDLTEVAGLRLARVRQVVAARDAAGGRAGAQRLLSPDAPPGVAQTDAGDLADAQADADRFVDDDLGWRVRPDSTARAHLARALATLRRVDGSVEAGVFRPHARAADWLASEEVREPPRSLDDEVVVAVAFDAATSALRRMAWEHRTSPARTGVA